MTQVKLSYEEQILNALIRLGGAKKSENATDYNGRRFDAVREILRPLYDKVNGLESELGIGTARQVAVQYASMLCERLEEMEESSPPPSDPDVSLRHLKWMCSQIIGHAGHVPKEWSVTKLHRWIGYIQGVMTARGYTTVSQERDDYRELKGKVLRELGLEGQDV